MEIQLKCDKNVKVIDFHPHIINFGMKNKSANYGNENKKGIYEAKKNFSPTVF